MDTVMNNQKIRNCSYNMLVAIILTAVNILGLFIGLGVYFPFSVAFPYQMAGIGYTALHPELAGEGLYTAEELATWEQFGTVLFAVTLVLAVAVLAVYVVFYLLSRPKAVQTVEQAKRAKGVLIAALVMYSIDTIIVIDNGLTMMDLSSLIDLAFHVWAIVYFVGGIKGYSAAVKEALNPCAVVEADATVAEAAVTETAVTDDSQNQ